MKKQEILAKAETVLTEAEYMTLEEIFKKTNTEELPACFDMLDELLSYSFTKFFASQPTVISTLLKAKADAQTKNAIEDFLESLTLVNETLAELKETAPFLDKISDFLHEIHMAENKYLIRSRCKLADAPTLN